MTALNEMLAALADRDCEAAERAGADRSNCQACGAPVRYGTRLCDECRQRGSRRP